MMTFIELIDSIIRKKQRGDIISIEEIKELKVLHEKECKKLRDEYNDRVMNIYKRVNNK